MCIAIPSEVVALDGMTATVECYGVRRDVSLLLLPETVAVGDYLVVQTGFAVQRLDRAAAQESLKLFDEILGAQGAGTGEGA